MRRTDFCRKGWWNLSWYPLTGVEGRRDYLKLLLAIVIKIIQNNCMAWKKRTSPQHRLTLPIPLPELGSLSLLCVRHFSLLLAALTEVFFLRAKYSLARAKLTTREYPFRTQGQPSRRHLNNPKAGRDDRCRGRRMPLLPRPRIHPGRTFPLSGIRRGGEQATF